MEPLGGCRTLLGMRTESSLWEQALGGDGGAFDRVFKLHRDRIYNHAWRLTQHRADAEDLTAIAFIELWRRRRAVRVIDGSVLPWLLVTTTNVSRNLKRSQARHQRLLAHIPPPEPERDVADSIADADTRESVVRSVRVALARLSPRDQEVLALCVLEELTTRQASAALGVAEGTVKSRLSRARARFAAQIELVNQPKGAEV
jgi:RNA polymerase sigma factor (sigma-70 family)